MALHRAGPFCIYFDSGNVICLSNDGSYTLKRTSVATFAGDFIVVAVQQESVAG
jgi:hypothetical protein